VGRFGPWAVLVKTLGVIILQKFFLNSSLLTVFVCKIMSVSVLILMHKRSIIFVPVFVLVHANNTAERRIWQPLSYERRC